MSNEVISLLSPSERQQYDDNESQHQGRFKALSLQAWRYTVASGALTATLILLANTLTLIVICVKYPMIDNQIAFYTGSCHTSSVVTTVAHIIINILSTILLAYSNFAMQCLNSPTRKEVDTAHSKQRWLNIGTPSIRNLFFISKKKVCLWMILAVSSFPLHMIWNSTVFQTKSTHDYLSVQIDEGFIQGANWTIPSLNKQERAYDYQEIVQNLQRQAQEDELERLSLTSCSEAYSPSLLADRSHVLLLVDAEERTSSVLAIWDNEFGSQLEGPGFWLHCTGDCDYPTRGKPSQTPVRECYSQRVAEECKASLVPLFMIIVVVCNFIKAVCFILALYITKHEPPLCTTGDAIQSFIKRPDMHTEGRCLVAKRDYERGTHEWTPRPTNIGDTWAGGRDCWIVAVNRWQIGIFIASLIVFLVVGGFYGSNGDIEDVWKGLNIPDILLALPDETILALFLLANVPQVGVSYVYLGLNNILTTMLVMAEWCGYAAGSKKPPKGLRVSSPAAETKQRSTYFLSLPYRWNVPTALVMALMHWLVSEMFYFVLLDIHTIGVKESSTVKSMGYLLASSTITLFVIMPLGAVSIVILISLGVFKRYPSGMPLAGCCSASIAASCQPSRLHADGANPARSFPEDLPYVNLKWGVVVNPGDSEHGIGHATFSAENPTPLEDEKMYT